MFIVQVFILSLIELSFVRTESFTSTTHLSELFHAEISLAKYLENYLNTEYERLDQIEK